MNKDFYHTSAAALEVKSKAPNGVNFNAKGRSAHDGPITGSVGVFIIGQRFRIAHTNRATQLEGKYTDKASGMTDPNNTLPWEY